MPTIQQFLQDQYAATSATRCIKVYIPDDDSYVPLLAGLLALAGNPENYQDPLSAQAEGVAAIWSDSYRQSDWEGCGTPPECMHVESEITISPITMTVLLGNAITANFTASGQRTNVCYAQSPALSTQVLQTTRFLAAGGWSYRVTGARTAASGILNIDIGSIAAGNVANLSHDLYVAGANQFNQYQTGSFTIPTDDQYFIDLRPNGKNAASSGFALFVSLFEAWRTS